MRALLLFEDQPDGTVSITYADNSEGKYVGASVELALHILQEAQASELIGPKPPPEPTPGSNIEPQQ